MGQDRAKRLQDEAEAIAQLKATSAKPDGVGEAIVDIAPARGAVVRFHPREVSLSDSGGLRIMRTGHLGRDALRRADAFDVMEQQARRRNPDAPAPFTVGQLNAARFYAQLFERCHTAGVRCSSLEAVHGSGDGSFIDAVISDSRMLTGMRQAIGAAVVLSPRGASAHSDRGRLVLRTHDLVDAVCVGGLTLSQLLQRYGWPVSGHYRNKTRDALCAALDRIS